MREIDFIFAMAIVNMFFVPFISWKIAKIENIIEKMKDEFVDKN